MKVLHVIPAVAPRYGGPSAAVLEMCRALAGRGAETTLATSDADGSGRLAVPLGRVHDYAGVPTIFFRRLASESIKVASGLSGWLRQHVGGFDVVHIHALMSHASVTAARASVAAGVPYVLRPLGTLDSWSLSQKPLKKRLFLALGGRSLINNAMAVHCTAPEELETLRRVFGASHAVLIPLGIDEACLERARGAQVAEPPYVLHLSRLHPVKRIEPLIDAFAEVTAADTVGTWRLKIAGDGDAAYVHHLKQHARRSAAADRIDFLGWVDGARKNTVLEQASLFALTSSHENFGLSALEALAAGVPVVVSDGVQLASWITEAHAGWVSALQPDDLSGVLRQALTSSAERTARAAAGRRLAARFAWPTIAGELMRLYERVQVEAGVVA